ncbi:MAG: protein phosphatase CheZ [Parvibaculaceae bacterium]
MTVAKKKFRIESVNIHSAGRTEVLDVPAEGGFVPDAAAEDRHREVLEAIAQLGRSMSGYKADEEDLPDAAPDALLDKYKEEIKEAAKLKHELELMQAAIARTKSEIVSLRYDGASSDRIRTVTDELDEVVAGTEAATETILSAAEAIDSNASTLSHTLAGTEAGQALEIQEQVIGIFEACNFQDITGQRITKVVNALRFIEERVETMLEIWGEASFEGVEPVKGDAGSDDVPEGRALANGPSMPEADDRASQADIDALFD